jgi:cyclopropane fatty-acyl-phospholipid synthase-like methyltransferase
VSTTTFKHHVYDQFRRPRGALGVLAGGIMSRRTSNVERSRWTVELLDLQPHHHALEVGYGPGLAIVAAARRASAGRVVGLDHSPTMQAMAQRRVQRAGLADRVELLIGDVTEAIPADLGTFDAIFSCNVWLFWTQPVDVVQRLAKHVSPGGVLAITHQPRHGGADRGHAMRAAEQITEQLTSAGLASPTTHVLELQPVPALCVTARCRPE